MFLWIPWKLHFHLISLFHFIIALISFLLFPLDFHGIWHNFILKLSSLHSLSSSKVEKKHRLKSSSIMIHLNNNKKKQQQYEKVQIGLRLARSFLIFTAHFTNCCVFPTDTITQLYPFFPFQPWKLLSLHSNCCRYNHKVKC